MMSAQNPEVNVYESAAQIWGLPLESYGCARCGQAYLLPPGQNGLVCPGCAGSQLQPQPAPLRPEPPEKLVPFQVQRAGLAAIYGQFARGVWLRPDELNPETLLARAVPVYLPMWLVDSDLQGSWQAEMGFDYQVKSSQEMYASGGWQTREKIETRVRWEPRLGAAEIHYDNAAVPALSDHAAISAQLGSYSFKSAQAYAPAQLGGAALRIPDQDTAQAWPQAQEALEARLAQHSLQAAGAQHLRRFSAHIDYTNRQWTQLLLPMYFSWYRDDEGVQRPVYVNGQSGQVGGVRLASQRKGWKWAGITAAVAAGIFLLALAAFALGFLFPPAVVVGVVLAVAALLVAVGAIVPAVWPWQWNRRQVGVNVRQTG